jgi:two-component system cell cycle response regulator DivK
MRILYVEDNPANISLLQRIARMGGHDVSAYNDGEVALAHFEQDRPDLILMDLQLAGALDGLDVVRKLRADGVTTPIIAVTAYAMVGDKERCLEAGCDGYLAKPLPVAELVETVQKYEAALKSKDSEPAASVQTNTAAAPSTAAVPGAAVGGDGVQPAKQTEPARPSAEPDPSKVLRETAPLPDLASRAAARRAAREKKDQAAAAKAVTVVSNRKDAAAATTADEGAEVEHDETQPLASIPPTAQDAPKTEGTQEIPASANGDAAPVAATEGSSEAGKKE